MFLNFCAFIYLPLKEESEIEFNTMIKKPIRVGLVDDHKLFRRGIAELIERFDDFMVVFELNNGKELQKYITAENTPDVILLDINMPELDGYQTATWLNLYYPGVKILVLSMYDSEAAIIKILKAGARGYLLKDADPAELKQALKEVIEHGYYHSGIVAQALMDNLHKIERPSDLLPVLTDRESKFLTLACSELTYKEIADEMSVTPRAVDGFREALFEKLNVKSRVGLVIFAIRSGLVKMN
jgi:two-component system, NarL family, invasion response regulator UvrY